MKKRSLSFLLFPLTICFLTGCNKDNYSEIVLEDAIPTAYVGEVYDFQDCFVKEDGYNYSIDVYSYHGATYSETKLDVDGLTFIPTSTDPISVVLHGSNGKTSIQKTVSVDVKEKGDPIEELLINTGESGYADPGFQKSLNTQVAYKRPGSNNKTSILVSYSGNQNYWAGGAVLCPNNFRCLNYWKDKTWDNAILRFWVYNDSDYDIEFGLRLKDVKTGLVDLDMTQEGNPSKFAKAHEWTEIKFALRPLGITHTLYQDEEGVRNDSFTIKVKWGGVHYTSNTEELILNPIPIHSYNFYVDELDIVPASDYPEIDTHLPDTIDRLISSTWYEDYKREVTFDSKYVKVGESSLHFKYTRGSKNTMGSQGMCLNSAELVNNWTDSSWDNAILAFWLYNDTDYSIDVGARIFDSERNFDIDWGSEYLPIQHTTPHAWTQIFISFNRLGINRPLYKDLFVKDELSVKFMWAGEGNDQYEFYVDGVDVVPASTYPEVDTEVYVPLPPEATETIANGWENMLRDTGWEKGTISVDKDVYFDDNEHESISSLKVVFNAGSNDGNPDVVLSPEAHKQDIDQTMVLPDFSTGKLDFDVKFAPSITDKVVGLKIVKNGDWSDIIVDVTPTEVSDGWYHGSFDFSTHSEAETYTEVIRVGFIFRGVDDSNRASSFAYLDNVIFTKVN